MLSLGFAVSCLHYRKNPSGERWRSSWVSVQLRCSLHARPHMRLVVMIIWYCLLRRDWCFSHEGCAYLLCFPKTMFWLFLLFVHYFSLWIVHWINCREGWSSQHCNVFFTIYQFCVAWPESRLSRPFFFVKCLQVCWFAGDFDKRSRSFKRMKDGVLFAESGRNVRQPNWPCF